MNLVGLNLIKQHMRQILDKADHGKCVEISTQAAIKEMVMPGLLAVLTPVIVGYFAGAAAL